MHIIDFDLLDNKDRLYSVMLEPGFYVDVKVCTETGLAYIMQNHDGSLVYDGIDHDATYPDYIIDEIKVIDFVKEKTSHLSLDELISKAKSKGSGGGPGGLDYRGEKAAASIERW